VTGGQVRPLRVAGVAGGVGTSTWTRLLQLAFNLPVLDLREYRGGEVDVLVTSNTAAATARLGPALSVCPRPPVLVVMHTVPGVIAESRSHLRKVQPHITARFDIAHQRSWLEMESAPGPKISAKAKDIVEALRQFPKALQQMYPQPQPQQPGTPAPGLQMPMPAPAQAPGNRLLAEPRAGPPPHQRWTPQGGGPQQNVVHHRGGQGG
jgi:hypothetical protein